MPDLQGHAETTQPMTFYDVIDQNPAQYKALGDAQKRELATAFFNKHVATQVGEDGKPFTAQPREKQDAIRSAFDQKYDIPSLDLRDKLNPLEKAAGYMAAQDSQMQHEHPLLAGIQDVMSGRAGLRGALQGLSAGGFTPGDNTNAPSQLAGMLLGQPHDNPVSNAQQGLGNVAGGFGAAAGLAPVLGAGLTGGALFGGQDANMQLNQGRNPLNPQSFNYPELSAQTGLGILGAGAGAMGNNPLVKALTGGMAGGGIGAAGSAINQYTNNQPINPQELLQAALEGAGPGAAFGLLHQAPIPTEQPIGMKGINEAPPLQAEVKKQQWGLDERGKKALDFSRGKRYKDLKEQRQLRDAQTKADNLPNMSEADYYAAKAKHLYETDTSAKKTAWNTAKSFHGKQRAAVEKRRLRNPEYQPNDRQNEHVQMHEAMVRHEETLKAGVKAERTKLAEQKQVERRKQSVDDKLTVDNQKTSNKVTVENQKTDNKLKLEKEKQKTTETKETAKTKPLEAKVKLEQAKQATIKARTDAAHTRLELQKARAELKKAQEDPNASKEDRRNAQNKVIKAKVKRDQAKETLDNLKENPNESKRPTAKRKSEETKHNENQRGQQSGKRPDETQAQQKTVVHEKPASESGQKALTAKANKTQPVENPGGLKTSPQEVHPVAKTLRDLLKDKQARQAYEKLPNASIHLIDDAEHVMTTGTRMEVYGYEPKTGEKNLSSNEEGINTEGGSKDKLVTPLGIAFNPKTNEFSLHAINHNYENRSYIIPRKGAKYGLKSIVPTEKPGLVGKYANAYFKPGEHVDLNQHLETALKRLPQPDLNHLAAAQGDVTQIKPGIRKRLRETVKSTGDNREEVHNYVQEHLSNPAKLDHFIYDRLPATVKAALGKRKSKGDMVKLAAEYAKTDPAVRKALKIRIKC